VLGNPPFLGYSYQDKTQKSDLAAVMHGIQGAGVLDFVCCWYILAARYVKDTAHRVAFVSTNSITQGEQVAVLWGEMQRLGMHIHFAHRTFQWSNEAKGNAAVHCVIVGFGPEDKSVKTIYEYEDIKGQPQAVPAKRINAYLVDAPDVLLSKRRAPICKVKDCNQQTPSTPKPNDCGASKLKHPPPNQPVRAILLRASFTIWLPQQPASFACSATMHPIANKPNSKPPSLTI
jgi:hypothetical protein